MSETTVHSADTCRATKHARARHLIAADERSLVELQVLLTTLPLCSTGRIFVEVPDESFMTQLDVPARMTLTWLDRSRRSGEPGSGRSCASGVALARAVTAWADEMLCDECDARSTHVTLLGGYLGSAEIVDHLTERLGVPADAFHVPEQFGLLSAR
jgi:NADPH-dependent ferric siderophore reductase